jgi:Domain of Unknown Function (DUF1080)
MRIILNLFVIICLNLLILSGLSAQNTWQSLFNEHDFSGWEKVGDNAPFSINNGKIEMHQKANTTQHSYLKTKKKYKNFILEMDCKRDSLYHYGILFRAQNTPDTAHTRLYGYQIKVDHDKNRRWTGGVFDDFGNTWRWLYPLTNNPKAQYALKAAGNWDHYRFEVINKEIKVWVNNIPASYLINNKYSNGFIAFKIHFMGNNPENEKHTGWVKNIKIITKQLAKHSYKMDLAPITILE